MVTPTPSASNARFADPLTSDRLRSAIGIAALREHLEALQAIANEHGGTRATGTTGFDASVEYVVERLTAVGYAPVRSAVDAAGTPSVNVLVERTGSGLADEVVMVGAHVDSVHAGPGINDNGSGVAVLLALAQALAADDPPERTVRLAFWGAEEDGPYGSAAYVTALSAAERARIAAYLNLDMLGSPNAVRFVYAEPSAAPGSAAVTGLFADYFEALGLPWEPIDLEGDSDHGPFIAAGIPTGGLFSGGIEAKTDDQAATMGGTAGVPADACSHAACDTIANVSDATLDEMADAIAHAVATLAGDR